MDDIEHLIIMQCSLQSGWCSLLCIKKYLVVVQGTKCTNHWPDLQTSQTPDQAAMRIWPHISQRPLETLWTCCQYPGARHHRKPPEVLYPRPGRSDSRFIFFVFNGVADPCVFLASIKSSSWNNNQANWWVLVCKELLGEIVYTAKRITDTMIIDKRTKFRVLKLLSVIL